MTLENLQSQEERKDSAFRQLELDDLISKCWEKYDYWVRNGKIMPEALPETENFEIPDNELAQYRQLLQDQNYVRRFKNDLNKSQEISKRTARIAKLKELLAKP